MFENAVTVPVAALFATDDHSLNPGMPREVLRLLFHADLIIARDIMTSRDDLLYGRGTLQRILDSGEDGHATVLVIELDRDTDELEMVKSLVELVRGECDFQHQK